MSLSANAWLNSIPRFLMRNTAGVPAVSLKNYLRWQMRHRFGLLGWPGIIAISLILVTPLFYFASIRPMQARLVGEQQSVAAAQEQILLAEKKGRSGPITPHEQLVEFYKFFPAEKKSPVWLDKLVVVAEQNGLSLNEGEYKVTQDKVGQLLRYKITLPAQGKYLQIRKFLASLPTEIPPMALENVQFERKDINDSGVQVKIRLVLYVVQES